MKHLLAAFLTCVLLVVSGSPLYGRDMRALQLQAQEARQSLARQAAADREAAREEASRIREQILNDKTALDRSIAELQAGNKRLHQQVDRLDADTRELEVKQKDLDRQLDASDSVVRELVGVIRINVKDVSDLVSENLQTALNGQATDFLAEMGDQTVFPGMTEIRRFVDFVFEQITISGEVFMTQGPIIDRSGRQTRADILVVGSFCAAYRSGDEVGFLNYSAAGQKLYALSRLPSGRLQKQIRRYMRGQDDAVPVDVSRGAALQQLAHGLSLWRQIGNGGPLVWPILTILVVGAAIVAERVAFLLRRRTDADSLIRRIDTLAARRDWDGCRKVLGPAVANPLIRVIQAGLASCRASRREMEDALQEAILKELPPMERFLSTLGMLAAIAPLLGLLGTVTGMIDTFQVITQYGTGDPRMMSGGISVALVTTMLGLSVAIPIMLAHTLLSRAVDNRIGQMEEKAVALVNIVHKGRADDERLD
jgi:biopolymer transport protein ExbB